ncbi:esterase [Candidatus Pelagibacter sp.]|nr:esterase [Candidatus Pelagibacter sp.]
MPKYKLTWKDLTWNDFKVYLFALFKAFIPRKKISNLDELENFIQTRAAWVSQVTLYGYLKTRMGTRYVLHFDNDKFVGSVDLAKWNIYAVALQDLTFFTFSYLKSNFNYDEVEKAREIFLKILDDEITNKMPQNIIEETKNNFDKRVQDINWIDYHSDLPFNPSALALYKWAPIAEELKTLDKKIVLNSVILKWDIIKKEFKERIKF